MSFPTGILLDGKWRRAEYDAGCIVCEQEALRCRCDRCRGELLPLCVSCCADRRRDFSCAGCGELFRHHGASAMCGFEDAPPVAHRYRREKCERCVGKQWCASCCEVMAGYAWGGELYALSLAVGARRDAIVRWVQHADSKAWVYFLLSECGRVKIGKANNVRGRVRDILAMNPRPEAMRLYGCCPGGQELESRLHRKLNEYRLHGEWFSWCPAVQAVANEVLLVLKPENLEPLSRWPDLLKRKPNRVRWYRDPIFEHGDMVAA